MKAEIVNVKFKVFDNHPGAGHKRGVVFEETLPFKAHPGSFAIVPDAGKHYVELMKRFNGPRAMFSLKQQRYEISYNIV